MGEPQGSQVGRLTDEMRQTAVRLQEVMGNLQMYLREQSHMQEDLVEVRRGVQTMQQMLVEGTPTTPSFGTRIFVIEKELKSLQETQVRSRDWWLKLMGTLVGAAIVALLGLLLTLYVNSKGGTVKP